jgi:hypothetical protein
MPFNDPSFLSISFHPVNPETLSFHAKDLSQRVRYLDQVALRMFLFGECAISMAYSANNIAFSNLGEQGFGTPAHRDIPDSLYFLPFYVIKILLP